MSAPSDLPGAAPEEEEAPLVELALEEPGWTEALPDLEALASAAVRLALEAAGLDPADWSVAVLACSDTRIAGLNAAFRERAQPTNVLSWPAFAPPLPPAPAPRTHLGDIAIALGTVSREAHSAGIPLKDHATHLILHGCLHLIGYDHDTDSAADMMEGLERRALARIGIPDPYERGGAALPHPDR